MIFLPVAERELRIRARKTATYRQRVVAVLVALAVLVGMGVVIGFRQSLAQAGKSIFTTFAVLTALYCLFEGARHTADCLSEETREGTLGLLFLADLGVLDVVMGKFASAAINSFYSLLAIYPVASIPLLMGGVTGGEVWRLMLALSNTMLFSLVAGLWISSCSRDQVKTWLGTAAVILIATLGPVALAEFSGARGDSWRWFSPFNICLLALEPQFSTAPGQFWPALGTGHLAVWLMLALTCWNVRRIWRDQPASALSVQRIPWLRELVEKYQKKYWRGEAIRSLLLANPAEWLGLRRQQHAGWLWVAVLPAGAFIMWLAWFQQQTSNPFVLVICVLCFNFGLKTWAALAACNALGPARRDGSLELLVSTPLTIRKIVAGHFGGLQRQFRWPVIAWTLMVVVAPLLSVKWSVTGVLQAMALTGAMFVVQSLLILDLYAAGWTGLWFGFSRNKTHVAVGRTVLFVQIIPLLLMIVPLFGMLFVLPSPVWSIFLIFWSQGRLYDQFRYILTQPSATKENERWWPLWKPAQRKPPRLAPMA